MSLSDPIADMLTRIRNASLAGYASVSMPSSKQKCVILEILKDEGFLGDFRVTTENKKNFLDVKLKYYHGSPVIRKIHRVSRPSLRRYLKAKEIKPIYNNMGVSILSTPQGMMTSRKAKRLNLGGEMICKIW